MAEIKFAPQAVADIEKAYQFHAMDSALAIRAVEAIRSAIEVLADHPLIGRSTEQSLRELVISFGKTGYVALYSYEEDRKEVWILGLRHQRQLDYPSH